MVGKPESESLEGNLCPSSSERMFNHTLYPFLITSSPGNFQHNLSDQERLLFASLAPTPQTATILKTACRTWEDHLWAGICIICEEKTSRELSSLSSASFWEGGFDAVEKGVLDLTEPQTQQDEEAWRKDVMDSLDNLKAVNVLDGFVSPL